MPRNTHPLPRFRARSAPPSARRPARVPTQTCVRSALEEPQAALALDIEWDHPHPVVVVSGELDLVGGELFVAVLDHVRSTGPGVVEVDLSQVSFVDTHGLTPALGSDVVLVAASRSVCRLLSLMGLPVPTARPRRAR